MKTNLIIIIIAILSISGLNSQAVDTIIQNSRQVDSIRQKASEERRLDSIYKIAESKYKIAQKEKYEKEKRKKTKELVISLTVGISIFLLVIILMRTAKWDGH